MTKEFQPAYRKMSITELKRRTRLAVEKLADCTVCAQHCHVNRLEGQLGFCRAGREAVVASYGSHWGEEEVLVGQNGSGTIFFSYCSMSCEFCQNCEISYHGEGRDVTASELADIMLSLQQTGCHNINLVSPSHFVPQILEALVLAVEEGLNLPLVYNTGCYDDLETIKLLDGIVDIYMPDIKFSDDQNGKKYASAPRYFTVAREVVKEMYRQVGDLQKDDRNIARRGLLVRHLVMPEDLAGSEQVVQFLANEISPDTYLHIMKQYYPAHRAGKYPELNRPVYNREHRWAVKKAKEAGLRRILS
ncbi:putative pyruvate formate lyase activating enzyme [Desulfohalotomaculum tongense]|uniref:4Fe-4S cluster-binding domain-containing protein n=1 Tax=Desulforadius tongensis TaxID=1216062 RepID=UPI001EE579B2|nr:4Fe-4S cluster-binding domain-containing protein [Desulforadius tongensis]MBM7854000.1 putative pyruvate formate lyase activating enzyme [Desulforadius tongensis]